MKYLILLIAAVPAFAQLTQDQKVFDFSSLGAIYSKRYAPLDWKQTLFGVNVLDIAPWLDRARGTATDLDFYELMVEYVSNLQDGHDAYLLPSNFIALLGFAADVYDDKVLIEDIARPALPVAQYPFEIGDELVSVDGTSVEKLLQSFAKYARYGNNRSTRRAAANRIVIRQQSRIPHAAELGNSAVVEIRRASGTLETYTIPWIKLGLPLKQIDPAPTPQVKRTAMADETEPRDAILFELQHSADPNPTGLLGYGGLQPVFTLPQNFARRLGSGSDNFVSGTYTSGDNRIGYIRIPHYDPMDTAAALAQFAGEIAYMQANTDGLVVDETRNTGGQICYGESILTYLIPSSFTPIGYEVRATREYLQSFALRLDNAKLSGNQNLIAQYQTLYDAVAEAFAANRGRSKPVPLCGPVFDRPEAKDKGGKPLAYTKPLIMLIDEFSVSTADSVPAMFQDAGRGPLVGWRTNGMGGSNALNTNRWQVGAYSEGDTGMTIALMSRPKTVTVPGYPATNYIENVGVQPDIAVDYMTRANLMNGGRDFVDAFTAAINAQIQKAQ